MIKLYLISIIIWLIMIVGTIYLFEDKIRENGWTNVQKSNKNPWVVLILASAIPLIRVVCFISTIMMVGMTKEKFDELKKELDDESN